MEGECHDTIARARCPAGDRSRGLCSPRQRGPRDASGRARGRAGLSNARFAAQQVWRSHHVIEYVEGPVTALEHVAFRAASAETLEQLRHRLQKAGVAVRAGEPEPGLTGAIRFKSPCGHEFEVFSGFDYSQKAYTGTGVRLRRIQHINLNASDLDSMSEFMTAVLGFRISDYV